MKLLWTSLLLSFVLSSASCLGQEVALVNAPEPVLNAPESVFGVSSSSLSGSGSGAIMPVRAPRTEMKPGFALEDWGLLGAGAALRFLDYKSTVKCESDPANFREVELPQALVHNRPGLGAFEASMVVANYYAYRFLVKRDHRKMARLGQWVNIGAMAWTVGRNYYELNEFWPRYDLPIHGPSGQIP
jgi:hypothetical protein